MEMYNEMPKELQELFRDAIMAAGFSDEHIISVLDDKVANDASEEVWEYYENMTDKDIMAIVEALIHKDAMEIIEALRLILDRL